MKTLSLTQPWATLVAIGAKKCETRSWSTKYRGPIAIHAAKTMPGWAKVMCRAPLFERTLQEAGYAPPHWPQDRCLEPLPRGAVLCTARLVDCVRTEDISHTIGEPEASFGDYATERWAWVLEDVVPLERPIPAAGSLGLWNWEPPV